MPILGITGGIATGKSTFCRLLLARLEADAFDADACAHEILSEDPAVRRRICREVHPQAFSPDGGVDRALLRNLIYEDAQAKRALEAILHPLIRERWLREAAKVSARGGLFVVDIPLLFETQSESYCDTIVTVACSFDVQLARLCERPGLALDMARKMISAQMPLTSKIERSDHVVWNDASRDLLEVQTDLFSRYFNEPKSGS